MKNYFNKLAALLAFGIGAMAIYAGVKPLLGNNPGYNVLNWLPLYNYTMGILTIFITAVLIWKNNRFAKPTAIGTFAIHSFVLIILQTAYRGTVAPDSLQAMMIRIIVWALILGLMFPQSRKELSRPRLNKRAKEHSLE
jgi:hypothetical protein